MSEKEISSGKRLLRKFLKNPTAVFGVIVLVLMIFMAIFANQIAPYDPLEIKPGDRLLAPSADHLFGTDRMGRDVFSRVVFGSHISLVVGLGVVALTTVFGTMLGLLAGYYKRLDDVLMRILDGMMAFPGLILMIMIMAVMGRSLTNVVIALTIVYVPRMARVVRGAVMVQKEQTYVEAARATGASDMRILLLHIPRNCIAPIIIQGTMIFAYAVLAESALSFLGVGVPPEIPSWGNVISSGKVFLRRAPWICFFSGVSVSLCVLALNSIGDGLRDVLDPRLNNKG
ncbi:ABC transporter permease [Desulfosediminicola ganghwensis]|uniref:ABC transporter permease n=1 Tax=Desulfosediminicola ganghwensis TaxID=2569540 RepID=UPI0010ACE821|nr:ABC transporter permease [Desulfosediminicola ganghwensis]